MENAERFSGSGGLRIILLWMSIGRIKRQTGNRNYLTADVKRTVEVYSTFRDNKYVVVRKGYEHPEIAMKILSVLFDHSRYEAEDADEMNTYFALNVDPTARPLMINVDYNEATYIVTKHIREVLYSPGDEKTREDLSAIEASYFDACKEYLKAEVPSVELAA